ncbi:hypothetical protein V3C99_007542 [Haemonchus contortus]
MSDHQQPPNALTYDLLENESSRSSLMVQHLCYELGYHLISNRLYRVFQVIQVIECIVALIALPVVHYKFLIRSALHINLKALLCLHFHVGMVYVLTVLTSKLLQLYEFTLWTTYRNPCDMFPSRIAYTIYGIAEVYCLMHMLSLQFVISIERTEATIYVDTYESCRKTFAILFVTATFVIPGAKIIYIYKGVVFTEPNICCFTDQSMVKDKIKEMSVLAILFSLVSLAMQRTLSVINKRRTTTTLITKPLTTRYQLHENIAGTSLASGLQILEVSSSILYAILTLICSELHLGLVTNERDTNLIAKEGCYIIPLAVAILPFLALHLLRKRKRIRSNLIQQSVTHVRKVGEIEVARDYHNGLAWKGIRTRFQLFLWHKELTTSSQIA